MTRIRTAIFLCILALAPLAHPLAEAAGGQGQAAPAASARADNDEPLPPVAPEVVSRNAARTQAILRAVRVTTPLRIDGRLDEEVYQTIQPVSGFVQMEPAEGEPATEQTEVWVLFDQDNLYVAGRCWDSHPEREVADEMRRDNVRIVNNDQLSFSLDTFHDRRTGYDFEMNSLGGRIDGEISDDGKVINLNVNPVWESASGRFDRGWMVEARIPFKSLRYAQGSSQVWGFQVRRMVRWKNELSFLTHVSAAMTQTAFLKVSLSPTLVGLEVPPPAAHLDIKPYVISSSASDTTVRPQISNDLKGDWGGDVKYDITKSLTADFTYNTDFAQAEADLQQVNLTRFSLFFPEKRDFFLQNSGVFTFGGASASASAADNTPTIFYSRRIGLSGSSVVPIAAGGRVTGRVGRLTVGALNMETKDQPTARAAATNFSVVRLKRDVFRRSSIGLIATNRSVAQTGTGSNQAYGIDGQFLLSNTIVINTFWAKTQTPGQSTDDTSYRARFDFEGDRWGLIADQLAVGAHFNPEIGFVRQPDLRRSYGQFRFSPRPRQRNRIVRKYYYNATMEYIENAKGRVTLRTGTGEYATDFQNGDRVNVKYFHTYEFLPAPLTLAPSVVVPTGGYDYQSVLAGYNFGPSRRRGLANVSLERGTLYDGHKTIVNVTNALISFPPHLIIEPTYSRNQVDIPQGSFTTNLLGPRFTYLATPLAFVSALVQYNSTLHTVSSNVRFRWEYLPGSELFIVWNDQRSTLTQGGPSLQNRALIVKVNYLFRL